MTPSNSFADSVNCWAMLCFRQERRNYIFYLTLSVLVLFQILIFYNSELHLQRNPWWPTPLFAICGGGALFCLLHTFGHPLKGSGMRHFLDFIPIEPRKLLSGIIISYTVFYLLFIAVSSICITMLLCVRPRMFWDVLNLFGFSYFYPLLVLLLVVSCRIRIDDLFFSIFLYLFVTGGREFIWCGLGGIACLPFLFVYGVCLFEGAFLSPMCDREKYVRPGQFILLIVSCALYAFSATRGELRWTETTFCALLALSGAVSSVGDAVEALPPRILSEIPSAKFARIRNFFFNGHSAGGLIWTFFIALAAYPILWLNHAEPFLKFLAAALTLSSGMAFVSCGRFPGVVRSSLSCSPGVRYCALVFCYTLVLFLIVWIPFLFLNLKSRSVFEFASILCLIASFPFFLLCLPRIVRDFRRLVLSRGEGG